MTNILNFFLSFDKLMKEKLVKAFYWLSLIAIFLTFGATVFDNIWLGPLAGLLRFVGFFVLLLLSIVGLRLLCEAVIALFRINDNLSPDGGKGETADVDLLNEARKAAETAASKAREAAKTATEKTKSALDKTKDAADDLSEKTSDAVSKASDSVKTKTKAASARVKRNVASDNMSDDMSDDITIEPETAPAPKPAKKVTAKKAATKKAPAKKTPAKKITPQKSAPKKTPAKPSPIKSSSVKSSSARLKKDGTPAKRPGPKPKS